MDSVQSRSYATLQDYAYPDKPKELPNGLKYVVQRNHNRDHHLVTIALIIDAGSVHEGENERGLAHLLEHLVFCGAGQYTRAQIQEKFQQIGVRIGPHLSASTAYDEIQFQLASDNRGMETALELLSEMVFNPTLDEKQLQAEKDVVIQEFHTRNSSMRQAKAKAVDLIGKGTPYENRDPIGHMDVVRMCTREQLVALHQDLFTPSAMLLTIVGDVDQQDTEAMVKRFFGNASPNREGLVRRLQRPLCEVERPTWAIGSFAIPETATTLMRFYWKHAPLGPHNLQKQVIRGFISELIGCLIHERSIFSGEAKKTIAQSNLSLKPKELKNLPYGTAEITSITPKEGLICFLEIIAQVALGRISPYHVNAIKCKSQSRYAIRVNGFPFVTNCGITEFLKKQYRQRDTLNPENNFLSFQTIALNITLDDLQREMKEFLTGQDVAIQVIYNQNQPNPLASLDRGHIESLVAQIMSAKYDNVQTLTLPTLAPLELSGKISQWSRNGQCYCFELSNGVLLAIMDVGTPGDSYHFLSYAPRTRDAGFSTIHKVVFSNIFGKLPIDGVSPWLFHHLFPQALVYFPTSRLMEDYESWSLETGPRLEEVKCSLEILRRSYAARHSPATVQHSSFDTEFERLKEQLIKNRTEYFDSSAHRYRRHLASILTAGHPWFSSNVPSLEELQALTADDCRMGNTALLDSSSTPFFCIAGPIGYQPTVLDSIVAHLGALPTQGPRQSVEEVLKWLPLVSFPSQSITEEQYLFEETNKAIIVKVWSQCPTAETPVQRLQQTVHNNIARKILEQILVDGLRFQDQEERLAYSIDFSEIKLMSAPRRFHVDALNIACSPSKEHVGKVLARVHEILNSLTVEEVVNEDLTDEEIVDEDLTEQEEELELDWIKQMIRVQVANARTVLLESQTEPSFWPSYMKEAMQEGWVNPQDYFRQNIDILSNPPGEDIVEDILDVLAIWTDPDTPTVNCTYYPKAMAPQP